MRCPSVPLPRSSAKHFCYLGHEVNSSAWVYALWLESHPRALRRSHWWELVPKTSEKLVSAIEHKPTFISFSRGHNACRKEEFPIHLAFQAQRDFR
jgi:hypothetical protein